MTNTLPRRIGRYALLLLGLVLAPSVAFAQDVSDEMFTVNNTWMLVATFLVFIMHLGFAALESGMTRAKNTVNILFKNTAIIAIGLLTYAIVGFNLMYPGDFSLGEFVGFAGFGLDPGAEGNTSAYNPGYTYYTDFIFQGMFAATAATIVSGAVAERIKLGSFLIFTTVYVAIIYPIAGSWKWGAGWLDQMGFYDFAGSTLVHSVGGWAALAGVIVLGPRLGKYVDGKIRPVAGHSMPLATIGVFLLWLGWYGFNGGSVLSADPALVSLVFVTTSLAAAAGVIGAMAASWGLQHKPDLSMVLNGSLAGLVGITAGADTVGVMSAIIIGFVAGLIVVGSVLGLDRGQARRSGGGHLGPPRVRHVGHPRGGDLQHQPGPLVPDAAHRRPRLRRVLLPRGVHHLLRAQGPARAAGRSGGGARGPRRRRARDGGLRRLPDYPGLTGPGGRRRVRPRSTAIRRRTPFPAHRTASGKRASSGGRTPSVDRREPRQTEDDSGGMHANAMNPPLVTSMTTRLTGEE